MFGINSVPSGASPPAPWSITAPTVMVSENAALDGRINTEYQSIFLPFRERRLSDCDPTIFLLSS
ncbi:hypothetical protein BDZ89DRAFT_1127120 [Hymenopellis radicata]|nr:hypothetical protein BDZ89DRAFT_1127120 [Hymenopellis radicata]